MNRPPDNNSSSRFLPSDAAATRSRVQDRLAHPQAQDRELLKVLRQKRKQPSQLGQRLRAARSKRMWWRNGWLAGVMFLGLSSTIWAVLFVEGKVTYRGVPYPVIHKFWQDEAAKDAYFAGDAQALHYRLATLGVEQNIKNYYRDQFENEYELDRHIHQIMFARTGYVGEAYRVDNQGRLSPR